MTQQGFSCGFVAIVGKPNVGKSTLVNTLVEQKVSIVTRKPQTTRNRIHGIRTTESCQMIFVDTPGLHTGHDSPMNRFMNRTATNAVADADVICFVVAVPGWDSADDAAYARIADSAGKKVLVLNKIDRLAGEDELLPILGKLEMHGDFDAIVPISALKNRNVAELARVLEQALPIGPPLFDKDMYTDQPMRFMAAETVRESLMTALHDELPYVLAITIDAFDEEPEIIRIAATVWVEKAGQKGIVIGKGGKTLKSVGLTARRQLESAFGNQVHLELWVKVREGWSEDESRLHLYGFSEQ